MFITLKGELISLRVVKSLETRIHRKTIRKIIMKDLDTNEFDINMVNDGILLFV
jgi:hypothetical protein